MSLCMRRRRRTSVVKSGGCCAGEAGAQIGRNSGCARYGRRRPWRRAEVTCSVSASMGAPWRARDGERAPHDEYATASETTKMRRRARDGERKAMSAP
ncbi:hypothetical protein EXIGLDRAFT_388186 [Exidia glandulosa HHB12029]|uniref:Uncharacterized protein n=1 Tax=Exidia glandulosa HHB12029 TaxID=1314781 RepID=A0A165BUN3_EXIGL|nr:hypothetical protein EXIGLDRAFT_388186 [Exidia glandulosa HHB12029]